MGLRGPRPFLIGSDVRHRGAPGSSSCSQWLFFFVRAFDGRRDSDVHEVGNQPVSWLGLRVGSRRQHGGKGCVRALPCRSYPSIRWIVWRADFQGPHILFHCAGISVRIEAGIRAVWTYLRAARFTCRPGFDCGLAARDVQRDQQFAIGYQSHRSSFLGCQHILRALRLHARQCGGQSGSKRASNRTRPGFDEHGREIESSSSTGHELHNVSAVEHGALGEVSERIPLSVFTRAAAARLSRHRPAGHDY